MVTGSIEMQSLLAGRVNSLFRNFPGNKGINTKAGCAINETLTAPRTPGNTQNDLRPGITEP